MPSWVGVILLGPVPVFLAVLVLGCEDPRSPYNPFEDAGPSQLPLGASCGRDEECASRLCAASGGLEPACTVTCRDDGECRNLAGQTTCVLDRAPAGLRFVCAAADPGASAPGEPCLVGGECRAHLCVEGLCRQPCTADAQCGTGWRCGALPVEGSTLEVCRTSPITAPTLEEYSLFEGAARQGQATPAASLMVPADAVSLTFVVQDVEGTGTLPRVRRLEAPDGTLLIDQRTAPPDEPRGDTFRTPEVGTAIVPAGGAPRLAAGRYRVAFTWWPDPRNLAPPETRHLAGSVRIKRAPGGRVAEGTLHLRVFLVGLGTGPTAATAPRHGRLQSGLQRIDSVLATGGVHTVVDEYVDLVGTDAATLATIDNRRELEQLFARSVTSHGDVLDLFVVRAIAANAELGRTMGCTPSVPGVPGVHGTAGSGVAVGWDTSLSGTLDLLGMVLAHAVGHYLGLWHVIELDSQCYRAPDFGCEAAGGVDPIADTPFNTEGRTNLMFPEITETSLVLTPGQALVVRGHPLVR